jgi:hypothetical protein
MQATATEFAAQPMKPSDKQFEQLLKQMQALHQNLRTVRHTINNNVAVIMAMAELTQRNPAQCPKLAALCLEKAPQIAAAIGGFSELFEGAINLQEELDNRPAASRS